MSAPIASIEGTITSVDSATSFLLTLLHRGGSWGYWWTVNGEKKLSHWWKTDKPSAIPSAPAVYFGVHPTAQIPERYNNGHRQPSEAIRAKIVDVCAVNCLFAEFDAKDYGGDKATTMTHIHGLGATPSVIVDSGGGYHCYWLLREPFMLASNEDRERARQAQATWVAYVGGDNGAKDLARVLRVPGSRNEKYDPPRPVAILRADFDRLYSLPDLETLSRLTEHPAPPAPPTNRHAPSADAGQRWLDLALSLAHVGNRNKTGFDLACQLRDERLSRAEMEGWMLAYARSVPQDPKDHYSEGDALASLDSALSQKAREPARRTTPQTTPAVGPRPAGRTNGHGPEEEPPEVPPLIGEHRSDLGNARRLVTQHGQDLRYCHPWAQWLIWDGNRWAIDNTAEATRRAKATVGSIYQEASAAPDDDTRKEIGKYALRCEAASKLMAMLTLAESEPGIPVLPEQLDADPWTLNVLNGTLNLRSGELRPHRRSDMITKLAPVNYDPSAPCPAWEAFLDRIMARNRELIDFLQRAIGYGLTGDTSEQCLFLLYGTGANGKSTMLDALSAMLGEEYALQIAPESLMVKRGDVIPNDIARLRGGRFVAARETEEGKRLAESLVKQMTGGDRLLARFMRAEFFEFKPEFKIFLAANHKPVIRGTDLAIWRRIRLVPFSVTIPPEEQDKQLPGKLAKELEGILAWAVRGCLAWQNYGLGEPAAVRMATARYRQESDTLALFLAECVEEDASSKTQAGPLYKQYVGWCKTNGEECLTGTMFGRQLGERGLDKYSDPKTRRTFYMGIRLLEADNATVRE